MKGVKNRTFSALVDFLREVERDATIFEIEQTR